MLHIEKYLTGKKIFLLIFVLLNINFSKSLEAGNKEYELYKKLLENYSKDARPVKNWNDQLNLTVNVLVKKISSISQNHQTMTIQTLFEMIWVDQFLSWQPLDFDKQDSIVLPAEKIWTPDLHLFNSAAEDDRIFPNYVRIFFNGTIKAMPVNQLYAHCYFDFDDFPYDTQECDFTIGSLIQKDQINIILDARHESLSYNSEWKFISLKQTPSFYFDIPGITTETDREWRLARFTLEIKRSSTFYTHLFVDPLIFILLIGMGIFILPPSCVERATMGVLLLLSLVIISLILDMYTPTGSTSISIIGKLIGFTMFMITWSTVISTLIIGIEKDHYMFKNIPTWVEKLLIKYLGKITFSYGTIQTTLAANRTSQEEDIEIFDTNSLITNQNNITTAAESNGSARNSDEILASLNVKKSDISHAKTLLILISNQISLIRMRFKEKDIQSKNKSDWGLIARVFDRFCLIVYIFIMLLGLFVIFI